MNKIGLVSIGAFVPETKITNADLEKMVDTTDEWIVKMTGIRERHIASQEINASDMAVEATRQCLKNQKEAPDLLICSTGTSERVFPYQASIVAHKLNLPHLAAFDINAACSGFIYGLSVAQSMMKSMNMEKAVVTASEKMTYFTDYTDRSSCILFGDGAASVLLSNKEGHEIIDIELGLDGSGSDLVKMAERDGPKFFWQDGKQVFKFAVKKMSEILGILMKKTGQKKTDRFFIIPHQANKRIIDAVASSLDLPLERFIINIDRYGNTSSASIGLALEEAWTKNTFQTDDLIFLVAVGGGLSWAGMAIKW